MPYLTTLPYATLLALFAAGAPAQDLPLVAIDPGHGGELQGAIGVCGLQEKVVTLAVSIELGRLLEASGRTRVLFTRDTDVDVPLDERTAMANAAGADLFLSVHANASTTTFAAGVETFFLSRRASDRRHARLAARENEGRTTGAEGATDPIGAILADLALSVAHRESQRFALEVQARMGDAVGTPGRGVLQAPFVVLRTARMPAVLVEIGFLSNADECDRLATVEHQRSVAQALAAAILQQLPRAAPRLAELRTP